MLRIAICDDSPEELQSLATLTEQYILRNEIAAEVVTFSHPEALMSAMETMCFHLYLLDIVMPMVNGLEIGKEIRLLDCEAQIIYATTEPQFALQAYAASPLNYLIKPIDPDLLLDTFNRAISKLIIHEERTFPIKTADSLRLIKIADIACIEYNNHSVIIRLTNGEDVFSSTFRENFLDYCSPIMKDNGFLQCHTAFIINMRRVEKFAKDSFTLRGGKIVPIAAKKYPMVRDAYMDYLMAKGAY